MKAGILFFLLPFLVYAQDEKPLRLGVIGLTHTHVHMVFSSEKRGEFEIVGIVEQDKEVIAKYAKWYSFSPDKVYNSMEELIAAQNPEAVAAFNMISEHRKVVEKAAPHGIHVMVEKPLAINLKEARKMEALAKKYGIHLLTNYETTWYPTNARAAEMVKEGTIGEIRKVVVRDGHRGPKKIGIDREFLDWLIDPRYNGGGASTDFGCYGANLMTWLMHGQKPRQVLAAFQQLQPENNPAADDDATIILTYNKANAVIQPSWNWPIGRKDMEIYGLTGAIYADNKYDLRLRIAKGYDGFEETPQKLPERKKPYDDPFSLFKAVIRNEVQLPPYDLSSLENNIMVVEILDAARKSAKTGKAVTLKP
ncbi:MAG: Gfo/Idh/MocA family oxidoreductase [Leadbetterella sp.]|nr:Gfo/Idh/MocA family oxidoreductase [Leadbetterella sp.]